MRHSLLLAAALAAVSIPASAADLFLPAQTDLTIAQNSLPAVSGINGKFDLDAGVIYLDDDSDVFGNIGGTISIPVGHSFGVQLDGSVGFQGDDTVFGGAVHAFTRDPSSHLIGVTGAMLATNEGNVLGAVGPELELYLNQFSIEVWAGLASLDYDAELLEDIDGVFAIGDVAWYATDNLRLSVGGSYVLEEAALNLGAEYQLEGMPVSITGRVSFAEEETVANIGLRGYFGAPADRTLIERHRQDDPRNRALELIGETSSQIFEGCPEIEYSLFAAAPDSCYFK